jgi:hypothetical protein
MLRVLVCGGRDYTNADALGRILDGMKSAHGQLTIIHGGAKGADTLAGTWALANDCLLKVYRADWKTHGPAAGPMRNQWMLEDSQPDVCVAFPGARGTADMVRRARAAGVRIVEIVSPSGGVRV